MPTPDEGTADLEAMRRGLEAANRPASPSAPEIQRRLNEDARAYRARRRPVHASHARAEAGAGGAGLVVLGILGYFLLRRKR